VTAFSDAADNNASPAAQKQSDCICKVFIYALGKTQKFARFSLKHLFSKFQNPAG
jgi:hypothetical protein